MVMSKRKVGIASISSKRREMTGHPAAEEASQSPQKHANDEAMPTDTKPIDSE